MHQHERNKPDRNVDEENPVPGKLSVIQPPIVGPTVGATITATPYSAKAWPRFCGGKVSAKIACSLVGMPPPPSPCRMRKKISALRLGARPHKSELPVKSATYHVKALAPDDIR
jgi:hypothetical protein